QALAGLDDPARRAAVKFRLAVFLAWGTGELDEAGRVCREAQQLFEAAGDRRGALLARLELAWVDYLGGRIGAVEPGARQVTRDHGWTLDRARGGGLVGGGPGRQRALAFSLTALAATEMGELAEARRHLGRALPVYGGRPWGFQREWARHAEAVLAWREGRP